MSGMYDPFGHLPNRALGWSMHAIESDMWEAIEAMEMAMRDPSLDDEWPEWAVG